MQHPDRLKLSCVDRCASALFGRRQLCFAPKHSPDLNLIEGVSANLNRSKR